MECIGKHILVIDDEKAIRKTISDYLEDEGCFLTEAANGAEGLELIRKSPPDAVIVDLNMPVMDGFSFISHMSNEFPEIPVITLSGIGVLDKAVDSMRKGAWDFLSKPLVSMKVLVFTLNRAFERASLLRENRLYKEHLEQEVDKKTREVLALNQEIITTQQEIIMRLGDVVETRSHETGNHVLRVSEYAHLLCRLAGKNEEEALAIKLASPMHDIGKIGIPDIILNKPGALTSEERAIIETHTTIGFNIFNRSTLPILKLAAEIALYHHERWDGTGYPRRLKNEQIPFSARITCLVDVFDAISHKRVYKGAWGLDKSAAFIEENSGGLFDPELVRVFISNQSCFLDIYHRYEE